MDWAHLRATKYAPDPAPPEWPAGIKVISLNGLTLLGIHETTGKLYWDGVEVVYYWWWRYMRHHEGYRLCCANGGTGRFANRYREFGDIHTGSFEDWWAAFGPDLFAEPEAHIRTQVLYQGDLLNLAEIDHWSDHATVVILAKDRPQKLLLRRVREILASYHPGDKGRKISKKSNALYPVHQNFVILSLWKMLSAYELRKLNPQLPLWEISRLINSAQTRFKAGEEIVWSAGLVPQGKRPPSDSMNSVTSATSRMIKKAQMAIKNTGIGKFPKLK